MAVRTFVVAVGLTPTKISGMDDSSVGQSILMVPVAAVWVGGADVTVATGMPVAAGVPFSVNSTLDDYYVVAQTTPTTARVLLDGVR